MKIIHISYSGPFQTIKDRSGKEWYFEMHKYCGPIVLKKNGDPRKNQPASSSLFWTAVNEWARKGQKVVGGICQSP